MTEGSALVFVRNMLKAGHHSVLEHSNITFEVDRFSPAYLYQELGVRLHYHPFTRTRGGITYVSGNLRAWIETVETMKAKNIQVHDIFSDGLQKALPSLFLSANQRCFSDCVRVVGECERDGLTAIDPASDHNVYSFRIICDRGISHEIVRHRALSFTQESQRYVNYGGRPVQFIKPEYVAGLSPENAVAEYEALLCAGLKPQIARDALPNLVKTELYVSGRWSGWKHFIKLREAKGAHPRIREIAIHIRDWFEGNLAPEAFDGSW